MIGMRLQIDIRLELEPSYSEKEGGMKSYNVSFAIPTRSVATFESAVRPRGYQFASAGSLNSRSWTHKIRDMCSQLKRDEMSSLFRIAASDSENLQVKRL